MKAKLIFKLDDPEEELSFRRVINADKYAGALWEILANLKRKTEHKIEATPEISNYEILDYIFEEISDLCSGFNIYEDYQ